MNPPSENPSSHPSLEQLFVELSEDLTRIAWTILRDWQLAADAVQEAFLLLQSMQDEIQGELQGAREPKIPACRIRGWLVKTVQHQALNLRRKQQRRKVDSLPGLDTAVETNLASPAARLETSEQIDLIRQQINCLPEAQQVIVKLRFDEELSFKSIADRLDLPLGTVLSRMRLALEKLRNNKP